ncbi:MAG: DUF6320 domain-containing protein [Clostridia bacterium]
MKKCKKCKVNIIDDTNICPLCKTILHSNSKNEISGYNTYPDITMSLDKYNLITRILILISIVCGISCIIINIYLPSIPWSLISISGIFYLWITIPYSIKNNVNIASKVLIHTVTAIALSFVLYYILAYKHWPILDFSVPIILTISNVALIILQIIQSLHRENYIMYQLVISILSIIPLILIKTSIVNILLPTYISLAIAAFTLISTIVFYSKDFVIELKKRFHF